MRQYYSQLVKCELIFRTENRLFSWHRYLSHCDIYNSHINEILLYNFYETNINISQSYRMMFIRDTFLNVLLNKLFLERSTKRNFTKMKYITLQQITSRQIPEILYFNIKYSLATKYDLYKIIPQLNTNIEFNHLKTFYIFGQILLKNIKILKIIQNRTNLLIDRAYIYNLVHFGTTFGCNDCKGLLALCYMFGIGVNCCTQTAHDLATDSFNSGSKQGKQSLDKINKLLKKKQVC